MVLSKPMMPKHHLDAAEDPGSSDWAHNLIGTGLFMLEGRSLGDRITVDSGSSAPVSTTGLGHELLR